MYVILGFSFGCFFAKSLGLIGIRGYATKINFLQAHLTAINAANTSAPPNTKI